MLVIRRSTNWLGPIKLFIGFVLVMGVFYTYHQVVARADSIDWISADPTVRIRTDLPDPSGGGCTNQDVYIGSFSITATKDTICVYKADGFSYGVLNKSVQVGCCSSYQDTSFVVSFPGDTHMYRVAGVPTVNITHIPNSKHLVFRTYMGGSYRHHLNIIKDFRSKLRRVTDGLTISYELKEGATEPLLKDENNTPIYVHEVGFSSNGEWLAAEIRSGGLIRFNMKDFTFKRFSNYQPVYGLGQDGHIEFAISDDGRYVAFGGMNIDFRISDLNGDCGAVQSMINSTLSTLVDNPCPERSLHSIVDATTPDLRWVSYPRFDPYGGELTVYTAHYDRVGVINTPRWVTITAHDYNTAPRLDYLALGDSYSSGEGDTEVDTFGHKYYRGWTDNEENYSQGIPREKCHVSTRSYPYLLARSMNLAFDSPKEWDTIACSGATVWDIQEQAHDAYEGQGRRLIKYDMQTLKNKALNEFIPGRQKQIEFVKKYKPKVITLTIGGNDVGFGDIILSCMVMHFISTCDSAGTSEGRMSLSSKISNLYEDLKESYKNIYDASEGQSKVYVLGYPQFIDDGDGFKCGLNVGAANKKERLMIVNSVTYMNNIIRAAAKSAGVAYIDIESSLENHRLCDGNQDTYITGISFWGSNKDDQESYHPNALGHQAIINRIREKLHGTSLEDYDNCPNTDSLICPEEAIPQIPSYFMQDVQQAVIYKYKTVTSRTQIIGETTTIKSEPYIFAGDSDVSISIHSDPINIGIFHTNEDGSLLASSIIPTSLVPGYHTLLLSGKSFSGEPLQLEQIILVNSSNPSDRDGDGVDDMIDACMFVYPSNKDNDLDGIDDACDPELGSYNTTNRRLANTSLTTNTTGNKNQEAVGVVGENKTISNTDPKPKNRGIDQKDNQSIIKDYEVYSNWRVLFYSLMIFVITAVLLGLYMKYRKYKA